MVSSETRGACVVGIVRPQLLVGAIDVDRLAPASFELILHHEVVHVRNRDYVTNLLLILTSIALFFQPAVYWLVRRARVEREYLADDGAIASAMVPPASYARALIELEELLAGQHLVDGINAAGGELHQRIARLLRVEPRRRWSVGQTVICGIISTSIVFIAFQHASVAAVVAGDVLMRQQIVSLKP